MRVESRPVTTGWGWRLMAETTTGTVLIADADEAVVSILTSLLEAAGYRTVTAADAHTMVLVPPDRLYVISPAHGGVLVLADA